MEVSVCTTNAIFSGRNIDDACDAIRGKYEKEIEEIQREIESLKLKRKERNKEYRNKKR